MFKPSHIYAFSLGAGLTVLLMLFIGYGLDGDMGFCKLEAAGSAAETPVTCAREWIGALSGWIAAIGALGVGLPTIKLLERQARLPEWHARRERSTNAMNYADQTIRDIAEAKNAVAIYEARKNEPARRHAEDAIAKLQKSYQDYEKANPIAFARTEQQGRKTKNQKEKELRETLGFTNYEKFKTLKINATNIEDVLNALNAHMEWVFKYYQQEVIDITDLINR